MMDMALPILMVVCGLVGAVGFRQPSPLGPVCGALYGMTIGALVSFTNGWLSVSAAYLVAGSVHAEVSFMTAHVQNHIRRGSRVRWIRHTATTVVFVGLLVVWPAHLAWVLWRNR